MKNKFIQWLLIKFYTIKGWFVSKQLKINQEYFGGINKTFGIYMGNNTFYTQENHFVKECGVQYYSTKHEKYTNLQLGLFKWKKV